MCITNSYIADHGAASTVLALPVSAQSAGKGCDTSGTLSCINARLFCPERKPRKKEEDGRRHPSSVPDMAYAAAKAVRLHLLTHSVLNDVMEAVGQHSKARGVPKLVSATVDLKQLLPIQRWVP